MLDIGTNRSRKWQITINNPLDYDFTHEKIKEIMQSHKYLYFCFCDEIGEQGTPHTHIFMQFENAVSFDTIKSRFPVAHIETAQGTAEQNRDYIRKEGAYLDSKKKETNLIETFEEYGDMPLGKSAKNCKISDEVLLLIQDGVSTSDIVKQYPSYMTKIHCIEETRQIILSENFNNKWRNIEVVYIYGETGTGKTRSVMETFGYENVCKVTNYNHPFDNYKYQDVLLLDEFRSSLSLKDMLQYLDGYPIDLPCRYSDKSAIFTKVFIISNIPFNEQYREIQRNEPESWNAFVRRINKIIKFEKNTELPFSDNENDIVKIEEAPQLYCIKIR